MGFNPYEVLGLAANATSGSIRQSYLRASLKHHPDKGGDVDKWLEIKLAYDILSDDERRARFDQTGCVDDKAVDNSHAEAVKRLIMAIKNAVQIARQKAEMSQQSPLQFDIVALARNHLIDHIATVQNQIDEYTASLAFCAEIAPRFKKEGDGDDVVASVFAEDVKILTANIANCQKEIDDTNAALQLSENYSFEKLDGNPGFSMMQIDPHTLFFRYVQPPPKGESETP